MSTYFSTLLLTVCLEVIVALLVFRVLPGFRNPGTARLVLTILAVNLVTHPIVTIATGLMSVPTLPLEIIVFVTEAIGYRLLLGLGWREALALSLIANAVSACIGWLSIPASFGQFVSTTIPSVLRRSM